jgi:hypothetical protein
LSSMLSKHPIRRSRPRRGRKARRRSTRSKTHATLPLRRLIRYARSRCLYIPLMEPDVELRFPVSRVPMGDLVGFHHCSARRCLGSGCVSMLPLAFMLPFLLRCDLQGLALGCCSSFRLLPLHKLRDGCLSVAAAAL